MAVIVKNMDLPKNCAECNLWSVCSCLDEYEDYESILHAVDDGNLIKAKNCPLEEVTG